MSRALAAGVFALGLLLCGGTPALAGGALIEITAPLADRSQESVKAAMITAIDKAVRGASAMGFSWFQFRDARVTEHEVAVQILATDKDPRDAEKVGPGGPPAPPAASTDDGTRPRSPAPARPVTEAVRII